MKVTRLGLLATLLVGGIGVYFLWPTLVGFKETSADYHVASSPGVRTVRVEDVVLSFNPSHALAHVNEKNDEQQYIKKDGSYGPVIKIFAAFPYPTDFARKGDGKLVAEVYTESLTDVSAHLFPDLHSCVYLKDGYATGYDSQIVPAANGICAPTKANFDTDTKLDVEPERGDDGATPTARFDSDGKKNGRLSFGVTCGTNWCDITHKHQPRPGKNRKKAVTDEQYLATRRVAGEPLEPGAVFATIVPDADLTTINEDHWDCKPVAGQSCGDEVGWKPVATVRFPGDDANYQKKFNFYNTTNQAKLNVVQLRHIITPQNTDEWQARVLKPDGTWRRKLHVDRYPHPNGVNVLPAPAARWRLSSSDETMWVRCANGCCEIGDGDALIQ